MAEITDEELARYQAIETAADALGANIYEDGATVDEEHERLQRALRMATRPMLAPSLVSGAELRAAGPPGSDSKRGRRIGVLYWRKGAEELERRSQPVAASVLRELADVEAQR